MDRHRTPVAELFAAAAITVAVCVVALALYFLLLGWGYGGGFSGLTGALAYVAVVCWPAIPLYLLGRHVWRKAHPRPH